MGTCDVSRNAQAAGLKNQAQFLSSIFLLSYFFLFSIDSACVCVCASVLLKIQLTGRCRAPVAFITNGVGPAPFSSSPLPCASSVGKSS